MPDLALQRVVFSSDADNQLKMLKARTGLTPNILCRLGFCLSLDEPGLPPLVREKEKSTREINRYTLFGEYDAAFVSLLVIRLKRDGITVEKLDDYCVAHINRGVQILAGRLKTLGDLRVLSGASTMAEVAPIAPNRLRVIS